MTAELALRSVAKRYGATAALDRVSLEVAAGSYLVLLGPSGSGKTTLLSVLGGFTVPSEGSVLIARRDVTLLPPARRPTATVFQDYALFPHMSVGANVGFGLAVRGVDRRTIALRTEAALAQVGLAGFAGRAIAAMSGGQRQRVALARALVIEPAILLLDEPLGALDLHLRRQMQDELRRLQRAHGRTFVHVTHDQEEAMAVADLVAVMRAGRIEDIGPPARVYARPRTRFSACFMGESTLIEGRVGAGGGASGWCLDSALGPLLLAGAAPCAERATLALRPEAVALGAVPCGQPLGEAVVLDATFQGSFVRVRAAHASGLVVTVRAAPGTAPAPGERVMLTALPGGLVLLED